jgi:hypothetical protein
MVCKDVTFLFMKQGQHHSHLALREWDIQQGYFQPFSFENLSMECWRIIGALRRLNMRDHLIYIRGSIVEEMVPHPKADVDLVIIGEQNPITLIEESLKFCHRPLDIHFFTPSKLQNSMCFRLLLSTRVVPVNCPSFPNLQIPVTKETALAIWTEYNALQLPSTLSDRSIVRVCQTKILIRAVGFFMLMREMRFSRHLPTCLHWIELNAPRDVHQSYQELWMHMNTQWVHNKGFSLVKIQRWLEFEFNQIC